MATAITTKPGVKTGQGGSGGFGNNGGRGGSDDSGGPKRKANLDAYKLGMWLGVGGITMLFAALTSAYVVRFGEAQAKNEWANFNLPRVIWISTIILIASSVTFELARRALKNGNTQVFGTWILITLVLGMGFLAGQLLAWQQLRAQNVFISSDPHSGFFYVLTGTHGAHLICGVLGLLFVAIRRNRYSAKSRTAVEVTAIYWHFMDGLWIYLFLLLSFWR
jgi:cytochrome c oxidase subunit 3